MAEEYIYDERAIHDGYEDQLAKTNRIEVGTDEHVKAWKAMATRHELELKEIELDAKLDDMKERRAIEREKMIIEREKAEAESNDRAAQAKAESKRFRLQFGLSALALAGSVIFAWLGWETDKPDSERIRNGARERDRNKIFEFGDKLRSKIER